jgi:hypothetical protein
MSEFDINDLDAVLKRIQTQAEAENIRITPHAQQEMVDEQITLDETFEAIVTGQILENYHEHRRGACCLLNGITKSGRSLHIVCTTARPVLIIITVYEPKPPKWPTPTQRKNQI